MVDKKNNSSFFGNQNDLTSAHLQQDKFKELSPPKVNIGFKKDMVFFKKRLNKILIILNFLKIINIFFQN